MKKRKKERYSNQVLMQSKCCGIWYITLNSITIPTTMEHMQKFPMAIKTYNRSNSNKSKTVRGRLD